TVSGTVSQANNTVNCSLNGVSIAPITAAGNTWSGSVTILTGKVNYIVCSSLINGVTEYRDAITYGSPSLPKPTVAITQPAATAYTKDANVQVSGTSTVANSTIAINNSLAGVTTVLADGAGNWSASVALAEGSNLLNVTGYYEG